MEMSVEKLTETEKGKQQKVKVKKSSCTYIHTYIHMNEYSILVDNFMQENEMITLGVLIKGKAQGPSALCLYLCFSFQP